MARNNLNYYRGQYDPSDMYEGAGGASIISMYNPQSQAQFIDAVAKRQERFDVAKMAQAQEMARIGEMETYDMAELTKRLKEFEGGINSLVKDKYNGDYSAAANEIATKIGTERSNPFYHFNKQKVEMGKAYLDAKMKLGANFLSSGNPFDVSFQDWQGGKTFEFTPINSADITSRSAALFQNFAKKLMSDSGLMNSPEGQYFRNVQQYGFQSPEEAMAYAQKHGLLDQIYESMPELAGVQNQEAVANAIFQGASYGIGTTKVDYMANREYLDPMDRAKLTADTTPNVIAEAGTVNFPGDKKDVLRRPMWSGVRDAAAKDITGYDSYQAVKDLKGKEGRDAKRTVDAEIVRRTSDSASTMYIFSPTSTMGSEGLRNYKAVKEQADLFLNDGVANGDIIGVDKTASKQLDDLSEREFKGFSLIKSSNPEMPYYINLLVKGTPGTKDKSGRKAKPIEVNTLLNPESFWDNKNLLEGLNQLDSRIGHTIISGYIETGNIQAAKALAPIFGIDSESIDEVISQNSQTTNLGLRNSLNMYR